MSLIRKLSGLKNYQVHIIKRFITHDYEAEVKEIFRIAAAEYLHSLKEKKLSDKEIANEMEAFREKMISQQKAMLESLHKEEKEVPTAKTED